MRYFKCMALQYLYNLFVLSSKALNTLSGGSPHNTLSVQLSKKHRKNHVENAATIIIDNLFYFLFKEIDHVANAKDTEAKANSIWKPYRGDA